MVQSRFGLLGLCVALLGALALSASTAQAEVGAQWLFAERLPNFELIPFLEASLGLESESVIILHTLLSKKAVLLECKATSAENATLKANASIGSGAKIKLSGCVTKVNGVVDSACEPNDGKAGSIVTNALHALLELEELVSGVKDSRIVFSPDSGEVWAIVKLGVGECQLGLSLKIIGALKLKDCENLLSVHLTKHLLEPVSFESGLYVGSKTIEQSLTVLASWWAFLTHEHEGLQWSGDPA